MRWTFNAGPSPNQIRLMPDGKMALYRDNDLITPSVASMTTYYERAAKPKVLNRLPIFTPFISNNFNDSLMVYSGLIAIDTNTRLIAGRRISASGIVTGLIERGDLMASPP